jgi:hypothetical protein
MSGRTDKAVGALKDGGQRAKAAATKLYALAQDPEVQAKAAKLLENGKKAYRVAISPEAKEAYRKAAQFINKARKK